MKLLHMETNKPLEREKPPFDQVHQTYFRSVCAHMHTKIGNAHDAEDQTEDAFVYCYRRYADYDPGKGALITWLYLVVNSRIKNYYRDRKEAVDLEELAPVLADDAPEIEQAVYLQQLRDMLAGALQMLPERQRAIVVQRYFGQKSTAEIADSLGLSEGNVRVLLSRALRKMEEQCRCFHREG